MRNIAFSAQQYQVALRRVNVALPLELIQELLDLLEQLKDAGKVRRTEANEYSVLDFIGNIVGKSGNYKVWERLQQEYPDTLTFCQGVKLPRKDGKQANIESPVTDEFGILLITYILPGKFGERLRKASAKLVIETIGAYKSSLNSLLELDQSEVDTAQTEIEELRRKLHQAELNHNDFCYPAERLHKVSRIVSFQQVKEAIKRDFIEGRDWIYVGKKIFINEPTYNILVVSFRSLQGTDISQLPEIIKLETKLFFQYQDSRRRSKNKRVGQCDGQLSLF